MATLPTWATQKLGPLPVWGWGALAFSGGVGYVLYRRRSSSSTAPTLATAAKAVPAQYPTASGDGGGAGGGSGSTTPPGTGTTPGGGGTTVVNPGTGGTGGGTTSNPPAGGTTTPAYSGAPAVAITPSLLGGGYQASRGVVSNPVGSALADALASGGSYTPSLTDYATEQPGGIQTVQAGLPGTEPKQGLTYSIYGTDTGTGPVIPAGQRKAGERYDALGRVIK